MKIMSNKLKISFAELERELQVLSFIEKTKHVGGGDGILAGDCFIRSFQEVYKITFGVGTYYMNESRVNDNLYNTVSAFDTHNNYGTYDTSNPVASINQNGVAPTVAYQTMNSMFDNVDVKSNLSDLDTNSVGVVNVKYNRDGVEGGHAVAVDGFTYNSNNQKIYKITDSQNTSDSGYYTESQFNDKFGNVQAVYTVGAQDWDNQANHTTFQPDLSSSTIAPPDPNDPNITTPFDDGGITTPYNG